MALHTKKLNYRRGGTTYYVNLYTTAAEVGASYVQLRDGSTTVYAKLSTVGSLDESHLRIRKSGVTLSLIRAILVTAYTLSAAASPAFTANQNCPAMTGDGSRLITSPDASPYTARYDWSSANNRYEYLNSGVDISPGQITRRSGMSEDGNFLVVTHANSPFISSYKWNGTTYVMTAAPSPLPTSAG
jgi:hypothetical protein